MDAWVVDFIRARPLSLVSLDIRPSAGGRVEAAISPLSQAGLKVVPQDHPLHGGATADVRVVEPAHRLRLPLIVWIAAGCSSRHLNCESATAGRAHAASQAARDLVCQAEHPPFSVGWPQNVYPRAERAGIRSTLAGQNPTHQASVPSIASAPPKAPILPLRGLPQLRHAESRRGHETQPRRLYRHNAQWRWLPLGAPSCRRATIPRPIGGCELILPHTFRRLVALGMLWGLFRSTDLRL